MARKSTARKSAATRRKGPAAKSTAKGRAKTATRSGKSAKAKAAKVPAKTTKGSTKTAKSAGDDVRGFASLSSFGLKNYEAVLAPSRRTQLRNRIAGRAVDNDGC